LNGNPNGFSTYPFLYPILVVIKVHNQMATKTELRTLARARLKEAQILFEAKRYDAATYLCGYARQTTQDMLTSTQVLMTALK
jgi:hypothetical protein